MQVFGYINRSGCFVEVGHSERGAKCAATRSGYTFTEVGYRSEINNMFIRTSEMIDGKWFSKQLDGAAKWRLTHKA